MAKPSAIKVVKRLAESLSADGFALDGTHQLRREMPAIFQFIDIQPGSGSLAGKLTVKLGWRFVADGASDPRTYDFLTNLGYLMWSSEHWIDTAQTEDIELLVVSIDRLIRDYGLPFLDRYQDVQVILNAYEVAVAEQRPVSSPTDPQQFFGIDAGWRNFQLGFAHMYIGQVAKAKLNFETVVCAYSKAPLEWVQQRKQRCLNAISKLESSN